MSVTRIVPYADGGDIAASRDFYVEMLGLEVTMEDPVLGLASPANPQEQVIIPPVGMEEPQPHFGVDVGDAAAVDAAHAEAVRRGLHVVYPLTDESWGGGGLAASSSKTLAARSSTCSRTSPDLQRRRPRVEPESATKSSSNVRHGVADGHRQRTQAADRTITSPSSVGSTATAQ